MGKKVKFCVLLSLCLNELFLKGNARTKNGQKVRSWCSFLRVYWTKVIAVHSISRLHVINFMNLCRSIGWTGSFEVRPLIIKWIFVVFALSFISLHRVTQLYSLVKTKNLSSLRFKKNVLMTIFGIHHFTLRFFMPLIRFCVLFPFNFVLNFEYGDHLFSNLGKN